MFSTFKRAQDAAGKLKVRSALNPFLWLCSIGSPLLLTAAYMFDKSATLRPFCILLVNTSVGIPVATVAVGIFFALRKPEKLQSEDYQIRSQALLMIQQMGGSP